MDGISLNLLAESLATTSSTLALLLQKLVSKGILSVGDVVDVCNLDVVGETLGIDGFAQTSQSKNEVSNSNECSSDAKFIDATDNSKDVSDKICSAPVFKCKYKTDGNRCNCELRCIWSKVRTE